VRNVHDDSEAVHFADYVFSEIRQAIVHCFVRRRIGPFVVAAVRERHVSNSQRGVAAQHREARIDHVPALDSHQRGNLASLAGFAHFRRSRSQDHII